MIPRTMLDQTARLGLTPIYFHDWFKSLSRRDRQPVLVLRPLYLLPVDL